MKNLWLKGFLYLILIGLIILLAKIISIPRIEVVKVSSPESPSPIVAQLIRCESGGRNVKIVDSNGYYSYGILQIQSSTWNWWSEMAGIKGNPMIPQDAIKVANWAVANGYGPHWTCWHKLALGGD